MADRPSAEPGAAPLSGLTVLDLTRVLSGPYCTMLLADMGARVIKIEQPGRGDETRTWGPPFLEGESAYFLSVNRNKESVTLDFKQPEARELLHRLVDTADILVENFRPGTLQRVGLDYDSLKPRRPALVYCSISGFGQSGPRRDEPGYDAVMQAEGGLMSITGPEGGSPFRMGVAIADLVTGLFAAQGITLALLTRERSGRGQHVDISMLDGVASLLSYQASIYLTTGDVAKRLGNRHPTIAPYDTFEASDGEFVLAVGNDEQFTRLCEAADAAALAVDPRFATNPARVQHYRALRDALAPALRRRSRDEWIARLRAAGVPCGSVRDVGEALRDPQLEARAMIESVEHAAAGLIRVLGVPIKLSETPGAVRTAPPTLGQHTEQVLREDLGLDASRIAALRAAGAI
jgi:crotonobetainyl-CoA:carnitine CoA-transferase CaiB-like acyl-CoA transferase